jgi:hypothetical protein
MKFGRKQFTLGSPMILIALLAVGLAYPVVTIELLVGCLASAGCVLLLTRFYFLCIKPCRSMLVSADRWLASKGRPRPPAEPEP